MSNNTVTISKVSLSALEKQVLKTAKVLEELRKKLLLSMPARYGSSLWWEKEEISADDEIHTGKVKEYQNVDEFMTHLNDLSAKSSS